MTILDIFKRAFERGCGIQLSKILRTERYRKLAKSVKSLHQVYGPDTDRGIALRAGNLVMGQLLNNHSETEALQMARSASPAFGCETKFRPLIQLLGESLVLAAGRCLPDHVIEMAGKWKDSGFDERMDIVRKLYFTFRSISQETGDRDLTMDIAMQKLHDKTVFRTADDDCLPFIFGKWDPVKNIANCVGKTEMLTAFARLAGARVLTACPIISSHDCVDSAREKVFRLILADLSKRDLRNGCPQFEESLRAQSMMIEINRVRQHFHSGVAIEVAEGKWVMLDPHGLDWGPIPDQWDMPGINATLEKYSSVVPGIHLFGHDHGESGQVIEKRLDIVRDLIARSVRMGEAIHDEAENIADVIRLVSDSDDLDVLLKLNAENRGDICPAIIPECREFVATHVVIQSGDRNIMFRAFRDRDFHNLLVKQWLTFYHAVAMDVLKNQMTDAGELIHPVCDFGVSEYSIGISVLNSVSFNVDANLPGLHRFFLDYSLEQTTLYNSMIQLFTGRDPEVGMAAARAAANLPFVHPLCQRKLDFARILL
jgi:hypothetical protein